MTIDRSKNITIPSWLFTTIVSLLLAAFTAWGVVSAKNASTEIRLDHVERDMGNKVNRDEFKMVVDKLNTIDAKLDRLHGI